MPKQALSAPPQIRVKVSAGDHDRYRKLARRYGYQQLAPFVRLLLDSADAATEQGVIRLFGGGDTEAA